MIEIMFSIMTAPIMIVVIMCIALLIALLLVYRKTEASESPLVAYSGKVAAISAASPGGFGGLRGLVPLRMMLGNIGVTLVPQQLAISFADKAFDANGKLTDEKHAGVLKNVVENLINTTEKLRR